MADRGESLLAVAALVVAYGLGEVAGGYGFLSVFVCALAFRSAERAHDYHAAMHEVVERLERLLTLFVLLVLGIALTRGLLDSLDWRGVAIGLGLILVVRPAAGMVALAPFGRPADKVGGLHRREQGPRRSSESAGSARSTTSHSPPARPTSSARTGSGRPSRSPSSRPSWCTACSRSR